MIIESCCLYEDILKSIVLNTENLKKLVLKCDYCLSSFYRIETTYIWGLKNLQEIELIQINKIGDEVIFGIARNCKELLRVILHCKYILAVMNQYIHLFTYILVLYIAALHIKLSVLQHYPLPIPALKNYCNCQN